MTFAVAARGGRRLLLLLGLLAVAVVLPSVLSSPTPSADQEPSSRDVDKQDRQVSLVSSSEAPQQQTSAAPTSDAGASSETTAEDTSLGIQ